MTKEPTKTSIKPPYHTPTPDFPQIHPKPTAPLKPTDPTRFRPGTLTQERNVNFVLYASGMGDYLNFLPALNWIARTQTHVTSKLYAPKHLITLLEYFFNSDDTPRMTLHDRVSLTETEMAVTPTYITDQKNIVNAASMHMIDLGYAFFANTALPDPEHNHLLQFKEDISMLTAIPAEPPGYVVITPCATCDNRRMPPALFLALKNHILAKGYTPVLVGKEEISSMHTAAMDKTYDTTGCLDLVNNTSLLQTASILYNAKAVVGIDNGLLHLAAMTPTNIVFGYTVMGPLTRQPRRPKGRTIDIHVSPEELSCLFCNERMRFLFDHDFKFCIYKDNACCEKLAEPKYISDWLLALDYLL